MSKKQRREQARAAGEAAGARISEATVVGDISANVGALEGTFTDPQAIRTAMEDAVEVVSETVPEDRTLVPGDIDLGPMLVAGKPSTMDLEDAMTTWELLPADVLAWRGFTPEAESVLVTAGGAKLFWPSDMDRTLTDAEKGRAVPQPTGEPGGVGRFTRKAD